MNIEDAIDDRICQVLRNWEMENGLLRKQQQALLNFIGANSSSMTTRIEDLEKFIRSTSVSEPGVGLREHLALPSDLPGRFPDVPADITHDEFFKELKMMITVTVGMVSSQKSVAVQNIMDSLLVAPTIFLDFRQRRRKELAKKSHGQYKANGANYVSQIAVSTLRSLHNEDTAKQLVEVQLDGLESYVKEIEENTPTLLKANEALLQSISKDKRDKTVITNLYTPLESQTKQLLDRSAKFAFETIREYEMTWDDVDSKSSRFDGHGVMHKMAHLIPEDGLFASFGTGRLTKNLETKVILKSYSRLMGTSQALEEEQHIR